jgi:Flp pilus assembly protein TadG
MSLLFQTPAEMTDVREGTFRKSCRAALRVLRRRTWRGDERGSAAVEFAVIAPVFFFLMFVIAETALVFIAEQVMDNAVFETARLIRTGQAKSMSKADFTAQVCARMSVFVNCTSPGFFLDVKSYANFAAMSTNNPTIDTGGAFTDPQGFDPGSASSIIMVRVYYQWPVITIPFTPFSLSTAGLSGKRLIGTFAAFCNEPFESTSTTCGS